MNVFENFLKGWIMAKIQYEERRPRGKAQQLILQANTIID